MTINMVIPQNKVAIAGQTVKFYCLSEKAGHWTKHGGYLPSSSTVFYDPQKNTIVLSLPEVKTKDSGIYTCHGEKKFTTFQQNSYLIVVGECTESAGESHTPYSIIHI